VSSYDFSTRGTTKDIGFGVSLALDERFSLRAGVSYYKADENGSYLGGMPGLHVTYLQMTCHFD